MTTGGGGVVTGGDGGITTGEGGGTSAADGLTPQAAFADLQEGMFKYLLNGDEVIVAPGTYSTPIDFGNNDAKVTISATGTAQDTILDLAGNTKGYTRCFRQGRYELDYGRSGSLEVIFKPVQSAVVSGLALRGGSIAEDSHTGTTFPDSSVNYYGVVGGGAFGGSFTNCVITGCEAKDYGGGAYGAVLNHCIVEDCSAAVGGGCANCELSYCTVVGNVATSAAGGVDGECEAYYSIIVGNEAAGKANEYAATTTPVKLTPQVPTIDNCFTSGDPLFCADYHLASGSPAEGKGAYPTPDATECLVFVEIVGGGTVSPNEIGGNALLAKVGALYHDIGKIMAPIYFTENQNNGFNPHDNIDYEESAHIITQHVRDGVTLAKKYRLPSEVTDFIRTHHGTTVTGYFYAQAKLHRTEDEIKIADYRYPGPTPFSRETAVVMLVDSVEAACKSLKNHDKESIDRMVDKIIDDKTSMNQLNNCPLTLQDITRIRTHLKERMMSIYHVRIEYPVK